MILKTTQDEMRKLASTWIDKYENVIEVGCNDGNFASLLKQQGIINYIGVDIQKKKIKAAKINNPDMHFMCCDILENLDMLGGVTTFCAFQCLEHIENDLKILKALNKGTTVIISVPNRPYKGHVRWFELEGWVDRFSKYIYFDKSITIQHPKKEQTRAFLFKGVRK